MSYLIKDANGYKAVPIEAKLLADRDLYLTGEINSMMAIEFHKRMTILKKDDDTAIFVYISSCGGDVNAALTIIDIIKTIDIPVYIIVLDKAYSAASLILACGQTGKRYAMPHSEIMLHEISTQINGQYSSIKNRNKNLERICDTVNHLYAEATHKPINVIENEISYDHFFTSAEAKEFGIVDEVIGFSYDTDYITSNHFG